jgi:crotonobetainyl-CoA:carnitine CoA-transferase CaiB-like acyl-CoA transferase
LSHFGAEVIKVEPPQGGDPLRKWRELDQEDGMSPWWRSLNRNKRSIAIDLRTHRGQKIAKDLALQSDVVLENFKPGVLEKFGMAPEEMYKLKPDLIFTRISGWGQNGPMKGEGGFAAVAEAFAGFRYVNGFPDEDGNLAGGKSSDSGCQERMR